MATSEAVEASWTGPLRERPPRWGRTPSPVRRAKAAPQLLLHAASPVRGVPVAAPRAPAGLGRRAGSGSVPARRGGVCAAHRATGRPGAGMMPRNRPTGGPYSPRWGIGHGWRVRAKCPLRRRSPLLEPRRPLPCPASTTECREGGCLPSQRRPSSSSPRAAAPTARPLHQRPQPPVSAQRNPSITKRWTVSLISSPTWFTEKQPSATSRRRGGISPSDQRSGSSWPPTSLPLLLPPGRLAYQQQRSMNGRGRCQVGATLEAVGSCLAMSDRSAYISGPYLACPEIIQALSERERALGVAAGRLAVHGTRTPEQVRALFPSE